METVVWVRCHIFLLFRTNNFSRSRVSIYVEERLFCLTLSCRMALAFVEAGAHVYAIDVPEQPSEEFKIVAEHCRLMSRDLKYVLPLVP